MWNWLRVPHTIKASSRLRTLLRVKRTYSYCNASPWLEISWVGEKFLWATASDRGFLSPYQLAH